MRKNEEYDFIAPVSAERDAIMLQNTELMYAKEQGMEEIQRKVIKNMNSKGIDIETIADVVSLDVEKVKEIIEEG